MCRYKNAGVAGYVEAFLPVQSDSQASEWCSYFENDVLETFGGKEERAKRLMCFALLFMKFTKSSFALLREICYIKK